jgi:hypothetical protein
MIGSRYKKFLTIVGMVLVFNFIFSIFATAKDFEMVIKKEAIHPKLSSRLWELEKEYEKGAMAAREYAQSRNLRIESPDKITVFIISEPGTIVDETS